MKAQTNTATQSLVGRLSMLSVANVGVPAEYV